MKEGHRLAEQAAKLIDVLEEQIGEDDEIGEIMLLCEVHTKDEVEWDTTEGVTHGHA